MVTHPELITTAEQIRQLAERLKASGIVAFDTEFIRESTFYPVVEIIQVATAEESWLVDARAFFNRRQPQNAEAGKQALKPLLDIFTDPSILKVVHAAQGDQECLYTSFGVVAKPTLDTAVAASLCGYGDGVGLANLLKAALGVNIKKGHARTNWSVRPLPQQLKDYAHADVEHLVRLAENLLQELDRLGRRQWALELSAQWENAAVFEPSPEELGIRLARGGRIDNRAFAALIELLRWREERVRQSDIPRRWVADDNVLIDLARVRPKDIDHLSTFRGLNKGELKNNGEAILSALRRAAEVDEKALPRIPKSETPSASEGRVLDLLRCYVGILADEHQIAVRHLMPGNHHLALLRSKQERSEELVEKGILSEGAARLIGNEVIAFLKGERALSVEKGRIRIVEPRETRAGRETPGASAGVPAGKPVEDNDTQESKGKTQK